MTMTQIIANIVEGSFVKKPNPGKPAGKETIPTPISINKNQVRFDKFFNFVKN